MLSTVIIAENPLEPNTWKHLYTHEPAQCIANYFGVWPDTARIYHENVALSKDVTPHCEADVERLASLKGTFYVIVYPGYEAALYAIIAIVVIAAVVLATQAIPNVAARNSQAASPNNELSQRTNRGRPNGRIPDIFGELRSTPDLLAQPYSVYENHREVEFAYMCIGRGKYQILDCRDGDTLLSSVSESSAKIYGPNTSPNSGTVQEVIGTSFTEPVYQATRCTAVNGQVLFAPNAGTFVSDSSAERLVFVGPNLVTTNDVDVDFTEVFDNGVGHTLELHSLGGSGGFSLDGVYTVFSVTANTITLSSPELVNAGWSTLSVSNTLTASGFAVQEYDRWVGPFTVDIDGIDEVWNNFVCPNGLYSDDGVTHRKLSITLQIGIQALDIDGDPVGGEALGSVTVEGSAITTAERALTAKHNVPGGGVRYAIRVRRVTNINFIFAGSYVSEVKWRDLRGMHEVTDAHFGNVTTVQSRSYATAGALALKERKLNLLVCRQIPLRIGSTSTFTTDLYSTDGAAPIICAMCLDPYIGNRTISELDVDSIFDATTDNTAYFGTSAAKGFSYTFDKDDLSFEESIQLVANAAFCTAYRQGSVIKLLFEKETTDSVMLFNHRNKIPKSEVRTVRFGRQDGVDGIAYTYVDPADDAIVTFYIPADRSAVNEKRIESVGIRSLESAHLHAWREWNKIRFQNTATMFQALSESELLIRNDRILVADNTRPETQDGEVVAQAGLVLTLSQPVTFVGVNTYTMFLQLADKTVEAIAITELTDPYQVLLASAPSVALVLADDRFVSTLYTIVRDGAQRQNPFLVTEKEHVGGMVSSITAINYDSRYYLNDLDFA